MITTKHSKSISVEPPFLEKLGASVMEYVIDTDKLVAFSGEKKPGLLRKKRSQ